MFLDTLVFFLADGVKQGDSETKMELMRHLSFINPFSNYVMNLISNMSIDH